MNKFITIATAAAASIAISASAANAQSFGRNCTDYWTFQQCNAGSAPVYNSDPYAKKTEVYKPAPVYKPDPYKAPVKKGW